MNKRLALAVACALLAAGQAARADERARQLLRQAAATTRGLTALTADIALHYRTPGAPTRTSVGRFQVRRPNYALLTLRGTPTQTLASDGRTDFLLQATQKYTRTPADPQGKGLAEPWWGLPFRYFFTQSVNPFGPQPDPTATSRYLGVRAAGGAKFQAVEVTGSRPMPYTETLLIGPGGLLERTEVVFPGDHGGASFGATLTRIRANLPRTAAGFHYRPPRTAQLDAGDEARLIALGRSAPDFSLPTPDGPPLSLAGVRAGARATLLDFWYLGCPPCLEELPRLQAVYAGLAPQGLRLVAVDRGDSAGAVRDFWRKRGYTLPVVLGAGAQSAVFRDYGVQEFPVSVLLDASGNVVFRSVGFNEKGLRQALRRLGFTEGGAGG